MSDPMDSPPTGHGSDRYDYIEVDAPDGIDPGPSVVRLMVVPQCPDCRANLFVRYLRGDPDDRWSWHFTIAHDASCPTPELPR